eukprot:UN05258
MLGVDEDGQVSGIIPDKYISVGCAYRHTCGVTESNYLKCWGDNEYYQSNPPPEPYFETVDSGFYHSCAIKTLYDNTVQCWGDDSFGIVSRVPENVKFREISTFYRWTCGSLWFHVKYYVGVTVTSLHRYVGWIGLIHS